MRAESKEWRVESGEWSPREARRALVHKNSRREFLCYISAAGGYVIMSAYGEMPAHGGQELRDLSFRTIIKQTIPHSQSVRAHWRFRYAG